MKRKSKKHDSKCAICNELIHRPTPRLDGSIICDDCIEDAEEKKMKRMSTHRERAPEQHDRLYHGDRFESGEW